MVFVDPAKIGPELLKVNGLSGDRMFVLSNVGDGREMGECMVKFPLKLAKFIYPVVMCTSMGGILRLAWVGWVQSRTEGSHSWGPVSNTWGQVLRSAYETCSTLERSRISIK